MGKCLGAQGQVSSKANGPIWPNIEHIRDFMSVLVICKFEDDPMKTECAILIICKFEDDLLKTEVAIVSKTFFRCSRAGNSEVNG